MNQDASVIVVNNVGQLVTLSPVAGCKVSSIDRSDLGLVSDAWIVLSGGQIREVGSGPLPEAYRRLPEDSVFDAKKGLVLPGLIDSHTHPVFAGKRHTEFARRLDGLSYEEIAEAGGGIQATVQATSAATSAELEDLARSRLQKFLRYGVTTVEAKSGYGLTVHEERRHLEIIKKLRGGMSQTIVPTCLALHAIPRGKTAQQYVKEVQDQLLPDLVADDLARFVDAFIEKGYFSVVDVAPFFKEAQRRNLGVRVHADEFSESGGASLAADLGASSADHLQCASVNAIDRLAKAGVVATLLPGTSLYTGLAYANAKAFFEKGCSVALATDFNPGSCVIDNLPMIASLGALHCGLSTAQAVAAVTHAPAQSLGLSDSKGAIKEGYDADFVLYEMEDVDEWIADFGRRLPQQVWCRGEIQL